MRGYIARRAIAKQRAAATIAKAFRAMVARKAAQLIMNELRALWEEKMICREEKRKMEMIQDGVNDEQDKEEVLANKHRLRPSLSRQDRKALQNVQHRRAELKKSPSCRHLRDSGAHMCRICRKKYKK